MMFTLVLIGRPNVGKSTLFNRLTNSQRALTHNTPGVTRDRREGTGSIADLKFQLIDTGGLEDTKNNNIGLKVHHQTRIAFENADLALFLIDGRSGTTPMDKHFANWSRSIDTPIICVINKCEGRAGQVEFSDSFALGLGEPIAISAEHGEGLHELYNAIKSHLTLIEPHNKNIERGTTGEKTGLSLKLAIVGRPNVGKSTIVNNLIGENRVLVGPEAGLTRDSIAISWQYKNTQVSLIDTAGLRKKSRIKDKLESLSVGDTIRTIRFADVIVLVLDSEAILDKQDLTIARHIIEEGRAIVIVINKWDLIKNKKQSLDRLNDRLKKSLPQARGIKTITCSAINNVGLHKIMNGVLSAQEIWNTRVSTSALNRWLTEMTILHPPPLYSGRRIRLRYMTQSNSRPPTFIIFSSKVVNLPKSYIRYLINGLRTTFNLNGTPIRIYFRKGHNPYETN